MIQEQDKSISVGFFCRIGGVPGEVQPSQDCWDTEIPIVTTGDPHNVLAIEEYYVIPECLIESVDQQIQKYTKVREWLVSQRTQALEVLKNGIH